MTTIAPTSRRLTRYVAAPALALGLALGSAAVATAVWDIGVYDECIQRNPYNDTNTGPGPGSIAWDEGCCDKSGGDWKPGSGCKAPPPEESGLNSLPGGAPTHVMQPAPLPGPPGDIGPAPGGVVTAP